FRLEVREEKFAWLEPFLAGEEAQAAAAMVLFEMLKYEKDKNFFQHRHWMHYMNTFADFHQGTVAKLRERKKEIRLEAYTSRDIFDLLDEIPKDAVVIAFLPTYAGGYERMFKRLEEIFDWDTPSYGMIDEDRKKRILTKMLERDYLYLDDHEWKGLPMVAVVRKARMKPVYIYSNMTGLHRGVMKQQRTSEFVPYARLGDEDEITPASKLVIVPSSNKVVNYYRDVYLSKGCGIPADGIMPFIVAVDGKVCGFLIYSLTMGREIYLLADFAIDSCKYKRLAKLVLLTTQTREVQQAIEEKFLLELPKCTTMVFTDRPVSMKYRGLYKLIRKDPGKLVYETEMGVLKLNEVIPLWLKKYEKS
ncbi:MAG: hypothetical protein KKF43_04905, partial [Proteobacteria bacterium]|nr:hypothetical protein [Pseudomonadota bacterium]